MPLGTKGDGNLVLRMAMPHTDRVVCGSLSGQEKAPASRVGRMDIVLQDVARDGRILLTASTPSRHSSSIRPMAASSRFGWAMPTYLDSFRMMQVGSVYKTSQGGRNLASTCVKGRTVPPAVRLAMVNSPASSHDWQIRRLRAPGPEGSRISFCQTGPGDSRVLDFRGIALRTLWSGFPTATSILSTPNGIRHQVRSWILKKLDSGGPKPTNHYGGRHTFYKAVLRPEAMVRSGGKHLLLKYHDGRQRKLP